MSANDKIHRLIQVVETDNEDQIDFVNLRRKNPTRGQHRRPESRISLVLSRTRQSLAFLQEKLKTLDAGALSFMTVKVVLWDILFSGADILSDFAQGLALFKTPGSRAYGVASLAINWIPGLAATLQLISKYRNELPVQKVFLYALILLVFYPIMPLLAFIYLLYKKPKTTDEPITDEFVNAQYNSIIVYAITGGLESPAQLIFQVWLVLNGVLDLGWDNLSSWTITDLEGNTISLQFTATLCIIFSVISILKSVVNFNVAKIHDSTLKSLSWSGLAKSLPIYLDFVPYLASGAFFRIASVISILAFFNVMGLIPIVLFLIANFIINQITLRKAMSDVPHWLIMFMAIFVPACFSVKKSRKKLVDIQKRVFFWQSTTSVVIYGASLILILTFVNNPDSGFKYSEDLALNNQQLNVYIGAVIAMGVLNFFLSFNPKSSDVLKCCQVKSENSDVNVDSINNDGFATAFKSLWSILMMIAICAPLFLSWLVLTYFTIGYPGPAYVYYKPSMNETRIVQAIAIRPFNRTIEGFMKPVQGSNELAKMVLANQTVKDPGKFTKPLVVARRPTDIVVVKRQDWPSHREQVLTEQPLPLGIIIINNDTLKPSSPLPDFFGPFQNLSMPVVLIRQEDFDHFYDDNDDFKYFTALWMTPEFPSKHSDPVWKCDTSSKCLEPRFSQGFPAGNVALRFVYNLHKYRYRCPLAKIVN